MSRDLHHACPDAPATPMAAWRLVVALVAMIWRYVLPVWRTHPRECVAVAVAAHRLVAAAWRCRRAGGDEAARVALRAAALALHDALAALVALEEMAAQGRGAAVEPSATSLGLGLMVAFARFVRARDGPPPRLAA